MNNKKVTDHHAIIPTRELQKYNLEELPKGELAILQLIANRLCVAVGDSYRYAESVIELNCGGTIFSANSNWNGNGSLFIPLSAGVVSR